MLKNNTEWLFQHLYYRPFNIVIEAIDSISVSILKAQDKAQLKKKT